MAHRPDVFNQKAFEESLCYHDCPETFIQPTVSGYKLFVPLMIRQLGEERILEIVENNRAELTLGDAKAAWQTAIKYIVAWAEEQIENFKIQKRNER
jgi:hypothetical protein